MKKIVPDPPVPSLRPPTGPVLISFEDQLTHAWDLLSCASATAEECSAGLSGQQRNLAAASVHLIFQAQAVLEQMIEQLPGSAGRVLDS